MGDDILNGGSGNDVLDGAVDSTGKDQFVGGTGDDVYGVYNSATEGIDAINDFGNGDDQLRIYSNGFGGAGGVGAAGLLASARFTIGTAATNIDQRFIYDNAFGDLFFDLDGSADGTQIKIAQLLTKPTLANNSFLIV